MEKINITCYPIEVEQTMAVNKLEENYSELQQLVQTRQQFESAHTNPESPYFKYKTNINYADIHGNTLLHYAAALGDLVKVQEYCTQEEIDINLKNIENVTPLMRALANGHVHIAQYLYEQGATCDGLQLHMVQNQKSQEWLRSLMQEALTEYLDLAKLNEVRASERLEIKEGKKKIFLSNYSKNNERLECLLNIATQLNHSAAVTEILSLWTKALRDDYNEKSGSLGTDPLYLSKITKSIQKLLIVSAEMNHEELCTLFISKDAEVNPKNSQYSDTPLFAAVRSDQISIVHYFLKRGANPNRPSRKKQTPLMLAIAQNNVEIAKELLTAGADVAATDVDGNAVLHYAAKCASPQILKLFLVLTQNNFQTLASTPNIYGYTPLDIAIQHKNDDAILVLAPNHDLAKIKQSEDYGRSPIIIKQRVVLTILRYYFKSQYRSREFFLDSGHCTGFEGLEHYYSARDMRPYYFDTLALMASLDAKIIHDKKHPFHDTFASLPQAKYHKNIYDLLDQWANDIIWFQHHESIQRISRLYQKSREMQYKLISFYPEHKSEYDYVLLHHMEEQNEINEQQLIELLGYLILMPNGVRIRLCGDKHVTSIHIQVHRQKIYFYYDSNFSHQSIPVSSLAQLMQRIIDYKYIAAENYTAKFTPFIYTFCFKKDLAQLNLDTFKVFQDQELPNSKAEAIAFQQQSPNKLTHLHIAIMTHSASCVRKLLANGFCDLNAVDYYGRSILKLALSCNNKEILELFSQRINSVANQSHHISNDIVNLYQSGNQDLVTLIAKHIDATHLIPLFFSAIEHDDLPFVKMLVTAKGISVNHCSNGSRRHSGQLPPLKHAMEHYADDVIDFFLKNNASVIDPNAYDTPLELSITKYSGRYYKKLIESDPLVINQYDAQGHTAIHIAIIHGNLEIFKDLVSRGADILLKSANLRAESALQMLCKYSGYKNELSTTMSVKQFKLALIEKLNLSNINHRQALFTLLLDEMDNTHDDTLFERLLATCERDTLILEGKDVTHASGGLLYHASKVSPVSKFALLLKAGCNPNRQWLKDETPLIIQNLQNLQSKFATDAKRENTYQIIELLLDHQADAALRDTNPYSKTKGKNALDLVNEYQDDRLKQIFASRRLLNASTPGM